MADFELMRKLTQKNSSKIVLLVMDGVGGLPIVPGGPTELEAASTNNMDRLASAGSTGLAMPIGYGITPGSGPAHLSLFGYNPLEYDIGRGVLEAFGIGLAVGPDDVAARGNFCSLDENGLITDRRAGRIPTEKGDELCQLLSQIELPGVEIVIQVVKEYRFALILRGKGLNPQLKDTDPQVVGKAPLPVTALKPEAERTAKLVQEWVDQASEILKDHHPANGFTLRGFSCDPNLPKFDDVYKLKAACMAVYPMYKGVSQLVGMDVLESDAHDTTADEFDRVARVWDSYDFFFVHIKYTDSRGEDGDFDAKVKVIEQVDEALPRLLALNPDVLIITGDHSTPARMRSHSWHPVPTLLWAPATHRPDSVREFGETACLNGSLGIFPTVELMPLALAHAGRLAKYGA
ncbi:MAG: 2,3-bisphosphoglycerate-independent phosphoglycerate mutase [Anaerolineales bacterium]|nr:2,3-bisphosphoglycerate-independent phosphoglycerate mutase [Anaerolineales bacterium]